MSVPSCRVSCASAQATSVLEMANLAFAKRIYPLQNQITRELRNAHIFLEEAQALLAEAKAKFQRETSKTGENEVR